MLIKLTDVSLNVELSEKTEAGKNIIIFLHGFTGSHKDWDDIIPQINKRYQTAAVDLIGHGQSESPADPSLYTEEAITTQLYELIKLFDKEHVTLCGYSMGGRAALSFAVKYPDVLKGLIIESASSGFKDKKARSERIERDNSLSEYIINHTIEEFIDLWMSQDIFGTHLRFSNEKIKSFKKLKYENSRIGLSNSLKSFGTGMMQPHHKELKKLTSKVLLVSGELDTKFTFLNSQMAKSIPKGRHVTIKNAGHNVHLEEPKNYIKEINPFLNEY